MKAPIKDSDSWKDFRKWWVDKEGDVGAPDSEDSYGHHPLISPAMNVANSAIVVIDIKTMKYIYISPNYAEFTGWSKDDIAAGGVQFAFSRMHPEDQQGIIAFSKLINTYFQNLPDNRKGFYRTYWDFRVLNDNGQYFKVLQQDCALKYNKKGGIEELLVFASKIDNIISDQSQHLRLTDGQENHFYKFDHKNQGLVQLELLSNREMEVAKLIAKSISLKQIAATLNISFNTVKVHSTNIMQKLRVNHALEMISLLRVWGFI